MRFNLNKLKSKLPDLIAVNNNGIPEVVATMADGTELHTFMHGNMVDDHTDASCAWIRNKIAEELGGLKSKEINKIRMNFGSKPLDADELNLAVPRREHCGPFAYVPEDIVSEYVISDDSEVE